METLPVVNSNTNFEDIAKLIGQEEPSSPARNMFFLKINRDHEDDEGNSLPAGSWSVSLPDKTVYAKEIDFQVFVQRYQYLHYDAELNEMVNKSVMAKNLYPQTEIPGAKRQKERRYPQVINGQDLRLARRNVPC